VPQALLLVFSESILLFFDQPDESSSIACLFLIYILPGLFAIKQFEIIQRYLGAFGIFKPVTIIYFFSGMLHLV